MIEQFDRPLAQNDSPGMPARTDPELPRRHTRRASYV